MNTLIEDLRLIHLEGQKTSFFKKLASLDLLINNDFSMIKLDEQALHDFEQIINNRHNHKALINTSQSPVLG